MLQRPKFIRGPRGGFQLVHCGYIYNKCRDRGETTIWECSDKKCRASFITTRNQDVKFIGKHKHPADKAKSAAKILRSEMVESIRKNPNETTGLVQRSIGKEPSEVSEHMCSRESLARNMRYHRSKLRPPLPQTIEELQIPDQYKRTGDNENFLVCDEEFEGTRLLIFISDFILYFLCAAQIVSCDGTFDTVPKFFLQLFFYQFFLP